MLEDQMDALYPATRRAYIIRASVISLKRVTLAAHTPISCAIEALALHLLRKRPISLRHRGTLSRELRFQSWGTLFNIYLADVGQTSALYVCGMKNELATLIYYRGNARGRYPCITLSWPSYSQPLSAFHLPKAYAYGPGRICGEFHLS